MKKKKLGGIVISLLALILLFIGGYGVWWYSNQKNIEKLTAKETEVEKWAADPRPLQSEEEAIQEVRKSLDNSQMDEELMADLKNNLQTFVIPGLRGGWSIEGKTGKASFGNDWVPQGVTQSSNHYYISAYDGDLKLNSVIYQIDKESRKYLKTIILPSKAHVGGIAYDEETKRLFYSDDVKGIGGIGYLSQEEIDQYEGNEMKEPIKGGYIEWALGRRTSAITIYNHQLVVAKYGQREDERSIVAVPLNEEGLPNKVTRKEMDELALLSGATTEEELMKYLIEKGIVNSIHPGWNRLQGITIAENGLTILSQSNGDNNSKIWFQMPEEKGWSKLDFVPVKGENFLAINPSAEEVSLSKDGRSLAIIFESGAKKYREAKFPKIAPKVMDRVVILPMDKIIAGVADR